VKLYKQKSETLNVTNSTMHPNNIKVCMTGGQQHEQDSQENKNIW
jgi:uncharacterized protein YwbE